MTDTLEKTVPSRPVRSVRVQQAWVGAGGAVAIIGFFLEWEKTYMAFGPLLGTNSGRTFAQTTDSVSSGNSLAILWVVLIAGIVMLFGAAVAWFMRLDSRSYKGMCGIEAVLGVAGILLIWLTLPGEIDTWTGVVSQYSFGIWLTTIALAVGALAALVGLGNKDV